MQRFRTGLRCFGTFEFGTSGGIGNPLILLWIPFSAYPLYHGNTFLFFLLQYRETNANENRLRASVPRIDPYESL